jgi:hypothetical protein
MTSQALTSEGAPGAEDQVRRDLDRILQAVDRHLPSGSVACVALTGGFGRGEGGVVATGNGEFRAFNDYDLVVLTRGAVDGAPLVRHAPDLARELGLDFVDFGVFPLDVLPRVPDTVFWYELREAHRVLAGDPNALLAIPPIDPSRLPVIEGTRLLLNRGLSLLWAWLHLDQAMETPAVLDARRFRFTINSIHKAVLAIGDAALIRSGRYHLSYRERARRIPEVELPFDGPVRGRFLEAHERATDFKLHPDLSPLAVEELVRMAGTVRVWHESAFRWMEEFRIGKAIVRWSDYPGQLAGESIQEAFRHPGRYLRERGGCSFVKGWSRHFLDAERGRLALLPFLLYSPGPNGLDQELLRSGLNNLPRETDAVRARWREASRELLREWHP